MIKNEDFTFCQENFDDICKYKVTDRIKIAKDELIELIKHKQEGLKIISNKATLLLSYQCVIIAFCFNKLGTDASMNGYYLLILISCIISFGYTSFIFLQPSKIDSARIPPDVLLNVTTHQRTEIEYNYALCAHLNDINISNDAVISRRYKKLQQCITITFLLPCITAGVYWLYHHQQLLGH